jgi:hypothetical protein
MPRSSRHGSASAAANARGQALDLAQRAGNDELLQWTGLAALDATDLGKQLGMLLTWRPRGGGR